MSTLSRTSRCSRSKFCALVSFWQLTKGPPGGAPFKLVLGPCHTATPWVAGRRRLRFQVASPRARRDSGAGAGGDFKFEVWALGPGPCAGGGPAVPTAGLVSPPWWTAHATVTAAGSGWNWRPAGTGTAASGSLAGSFAHCGTDGMWRQLASLLNPPQWARTESWYY